MNPADGSFTSPAPETLTFGHDGHGSTRVLFGAMAAIQQVFTYTAYGELLATHKGTAAKDSGSASSLANAANANTNLLYNGEGIDNRTGLYNFRARWYSASNARFERLDPFAGNPNDPFSFHKYAYVHGDPIGMSDLSGKNAAVYAILGALTGGLLGRVGYDAKVLATGGVLGATLGGALAGALFSQLLVAGFYAFAPNLYGSSNPPLWNSDTPRPDFSLTWLLEKQDLQFEENVFKSLSLAVRDKTQDPTEIANGDRGAKLIAAAYVNHVRGVAGIGRGGWWQSFKFWWKGFQGPPNCETYCDGVTAAIGDEEIAGTGWTVRFVHDSRKWGFGQERSVIGTKLVPLHSFVYATFNERVLPSGQRSRPDLVLDPFGTNRPDVYSPDSHLQIWPIPGVDPGQP